MAIVLHRRGVCRSYDLVYDLEAKDCRARKKGGPKKSTRAETWVPSVARRHRGRGASSQTHMAYSNDDDDDDDDATIVQQARAMQQRIRASSAVNRVVPAEETTRARRIPDFAVDDAEIEQAAAPMPRPMPQRTRTPSAVNGAASTDETARARRIPNFAVDDAEIEQAAAQMPPPPVTAEPPPPPPSSSAVDAAREAFRASMDGTVAKRIANGKVPRTPSVTAAPPPTGETARPPRVKPDPQNLDDKALDDAVERQLGPIFASVLRGDNVYDKKAIEAAIVEVTQKYGARAAKAVDRLLSQTMAPASPMISTATLTAIVGEYVSNIGGHSPEAFDKVVDSLLKRRDGGDTETTRGLQWAYAKERTRDFSDDVRQRLLATEKPSTAATLVTKSTADVARIATRIASGRHAEYAADTFLEAMHILHMRYDEAKRFLQERDDRDAATMLASSRPLIAADRLENARRTLTTDDERRVFIKSVDGGLAAMQDVIDLASTTRHEELSQAMPDKTTELNDLVTLFVHGRGGYSQSTFERAMFMLLQRYNDGKGDSTAVDGLNVGYGKLLDGDLRQRVRRALHIQERILNPKATTELVDLVKAYANGTKTSSDDAIDAAMQILIRRYYVDGDKVALDGVRLAENKAVVAALSAKTKKKLALAKKSFLDFLGLSGGAATPAPRRSRRRRPSGQHTKTARRRSGRATPLNRRSSRRRTATKK